MLMYSAFTFREFNSDYIASNKGYFNENIVINDRIGDGILLLRLDPALMPLLGVSHITRTRTQLQR